MCRISWVFRAIPGSGGGEGIRFSLSPEGAASRTGLAVFGTGPAGSVLAITATGVCPPRFNRLAF
jgi:hypothetical protein